MRSNFFLFYQVLVDDSARLQAAYPGSNAEHIAEQQALVVDNWNTLQERASRRKDELHAAADLQRFLADVSSKSYLCSKMYYNWWISNLCFTVFVKLFSVQIVKVNASLISTVSRLDQLV